MNSKFEDKAKTLREWNKILVNTEFPKDAPKELETKLLMVEDAQKEIEKERREFAKVELDRAKFFKERHDEDHNSLYRIRQLLNDFPPKHPFGFSYIEIDNWLKRLKAEVSE